MTFLCPEVDLVITDYLSIKNSCEEYDGDARAIAYKKLCIGEKFYTGRKASTGAFNKTQCNPPLTAEEIIVKSTNKSKHKKIITIKLIFPALTMLFLFISN